jgi:hypothetical protein
MAVSLTEQVPWTGVAAAAGHEADSLAPTEAIGRTIRIIPFR